MSRTGPRYYGEQFPKVSNLEIALAVFTILILFPLALVYLLGIIFSVSVMITICLWAYWDFMFSCFLDCKYYHIG